AGERIEQETRGWVEGEEVTTSQRTKEYAADYRYFPEPDLPPIRVSREWVAEIAAELPELPAARFARFEEEYGLGDFEAGLLTEDRAKADYYEKAVSGLADPGSHEQAKKLANWITGDLARVQHEQRQGLDDLKIRPEQFAELVELIDAGTISSKLAKDVFESMYESGEGPAAIVERSGQTQISDAEELGQIVEQVLQEQPQAVQDYRDGKDTAIKFLVGQVMRATRGRANPQTATALLEKSLAVVD
ncbi:MAG: Asp-tRNA(Asn)/Glu-tRNA(Gln) amidotransferase GatCAB subunit B, partial [Chloroflexi bacterium]|nr:Asp-tRNA(Asn)/Glu-tRNA(Gln) amidotransferase GatCAB subunit B [Chloroflexota bacterium]